MSVLVHRVCGSLEEFRQYQEELNAVKPSPEYTHYHNQVKPNWRWPALVVTIVEFSRDDDNERIRIDFHHDPISQQTLLKILGLTKEEIKVDLDFSSLSAVAEPETIDSREV